MGLDATVICNCIKTGLKNPEEKDTETASDIYQMVWVRIF